MIEIKAHHMSFPVADLEASKAFYQGILGLEEIHRPDIFGVPGIWYMAGSCEVHLIEVTKDFAVGTPPAFINPAARHAGFEVANYDAAIAHLKASGVDIYESTEELGQVWMQDPDGHVIELICLAK